MRLLAGIYLIVLLLGGLLIAIFKGSRPPQLVQSNPTPPKRAALSALVALVCAGIPYATIKGLGPYLAPPKRLAVLFVGVIAPWLVGLCFSYMAARAANKVLRAIGALELLLFMLAAGLVLVVR